MRISDWSSDVCSSDIPIEAPALTVNRLCGSSVQSTISAAQLIALVECDIAVSGGAESMSRAPHVMTGARSGTEMGNLVAVADLLPALSHPLEKIHTGVTAATVTRKNNIPPQKK